MAARIDDDFMTAEFGGRVIATARYSSLTVHRIRRSKIDLGAPSRTFGRAHMSIGDHGPAMVSDRPVTFEATQKVGAFELAEQRADRVSWPWPGRKTAR